MRSALWPLVLIWLALHAALLAVLLAAKFLGAKATLLLLLAAAGFWLLTGRRRTLALAPAARHAP